MGGGESCSQDEHNDRPEPFVGSGDRKMLKKVFYYFGIAVMLIGNTLAQGLKSEISIQGSGLFTNNSDGRDIHQQATKTGGLLIGYRYNINHWLAAETNYGFARNTQVFLGTVPARVQTNLHEVTGSAVVKLPSISRLQPFVLAGGGAIVFDPTGNPGGILTGAAQETKGTFLYGGGSDYRLTDHFALRAEYRGLAYKTPRFNVASLNTNRFTHAAQPSAGVVFRF